MGRTDAVTRYRLVLVSQARSLTDMLYSSSSLTLRLSLLRSSLHPDARPRRAAQNCNVPMGLTRHQGIGSSTRAEQRVPPTIADITDNDFKAESSHWRRSWHITAINNQVYGSLAGIQQSLHAPYPILALRFHILVKATPHRLAASQPFPKTAQD